jgi:hypothetical protein
MFELPNIEATEVERKSPSTVQVPVTAAAFS